MKALCTGVPSRTPFWHALGALFLLAEASLQWQVETFFHQLGGLNPIARIVVGFLLADDYSQHQQSAVTWLASRRGVEKKIELWWSLCSFIAVILLYGHHTAKVANFGGMQLQQRSKASVQRNGSSLILITTFLIQIII